jgi:hypothetical protein
MERNYDEVIAEMLIELDQLHRKGIAQDERNAKFDRRLDLTIKRMVKAEKRLDNTEKRMEQFDKKLEQSIKELKEFSKIQNEINKYFLKEIRKNGHKK